MTYYFVMTVEAAIERGDEEYVGAASYPSDAALSLSRALALSRPRALALSRSRALCARLRHAKRTAKRMAKTMAKSMAKLLRSEWRVVVALSTTPPHRSLRA